MRRRQGMRDEVHRTPLCHGEYLLWKDLMEHSSFTTVHPFWLFVTPSEKVLVLSSNTTFLVSSPVNVSTHLPTLTTPATIEPYSGSGKAWGRFHSILDIRTLEPSAHTKYTCVYRIDSEDRSCCIMSMYVIAFPIALAHSSSNVHVPPRFCPDLPLCSAIYAILPCANWALHLRFK